MNNTNFEILMLQAENTSPLKDYMNTNNMTQEQKVIYITQAIWVLEKLKKEESCRSSHQ